MQNNKSTSAKKEHAWEFTWERLGLTRAWDFRHGRPPASPLATLPAPTVLFSRPPSPCPRSRRSYAWGALMRNQFDGDRNVEVGVVASGVVAWIGWMDFWMDGRLPAPSPDKPNHPQ